MTALLPYVFLTILVARGVTLPGASMGLQFYLRPDWSALKSQKVLLLLLNLNSAFPPLVFFHALFIIFLFFHRFGRMLQFKYFTRLVRRGVDSLPCHRIIAIIANSTGMWVLVCLIKHCLSTTCQFTCWYTETKHVSPLSLSRDAVILPIVCGGTSIFGGFAVFSIVGHMAYQMGSTNVTALMNTGPGLAFIVYPEALAQIPGAPIWTVLFFAMLFTLGLDSQFATLETMTSGLIDRFPKVLGRHKTLFTLFVCVVQFGLGMILVTRVSLIYLITYSYESVVCGNRWEKFSCVYRPVAITFKYLIGMQHRRV